MITKRTTLLLVIATACCISQTFAASKNDKIKEEKEENKSKELVNNATGFKTKNINKTIARVEAMLAKNPQLPRLTRGEIIALLDNITRTDELQKVDKRRREEKSLLVVLPFIPYNESSKTGLEELYTMEPMTKFVTEGTTDSAGLKGSSGKDKGFLIDMSAASSSERAQVVGSSIRFAEAPSPQSSSTTRAPSVTTPTPAPHKRRRKPSSMKPIIVAPQEQRPVYVHKEKTSSTTQAPSDSEEASVEWKPYTAYDSPLVLTQRPSTVKLPEKPVVGDPNIPKNHKPEGHQVFVTMPQLIMSSSSRPPVYQTRTTTNLPVEIVTARTVVTTTTKRPRKKPKTTTARTTSKEIDDQVMFSGWKPAAGFNNKPEKKHKISTTTTPMPMPDISVAAENLPSDMRKILGSLGLMPSEEDHSQKHYQNSMEKPTIPTSPIDFKPLNPVIDPSSYVSFKRIPDKVQSSNKGGSVMDNDMKQILASFGLMSEGGGSNYNRRGKLLDEGDGPEGRMMGDSDDSGEQEGEGYENVKKKSHANFTLEDINTDALSDEMKDMLADLGVLKGANSKRRNGKGHIFNPVTQSALLENPEQAERISKVLIDIKKLSEDNKTHQLNPEEIRAHLYNITAAVLSSSEDEDGKKVDVNPGLNSISWSSSQEGSNDEEIKFGGDQTFDGYEPDEEELLRIQSNHKFGGSDDIGSAPSSSFFPDREDDSFSTTRYLGVFNKSLQSMNDQPDPLSNEELHQLQDSFKNEVKRQQPDNSTSTTSEASLDTTSEEPSTTSEAPSSSESSSSELSSSTESSSSTTEATTTSSEEPSSSNPEDSVPAEANEPTMTPSTTTADSSNIRDLEESFGGDTPTQRPNGLYFLLDWNSFLRVGQDNRTVNLSFSPKVGDPRNFIQVNVP